MSVPLYLSRYYLPVHLHLSRYESVSVHFHLSMYLWQPKCSNTSTIVPFWTYQRLYRTLRSLLKTFLTEPCFLLKIGWRSFGYVAAKTWNNIQDDFKIGETLGWFSSCWYVVAMTWNDFPDDFRTIMTSRLFPFLLESVFINTLTILVYTSLSNKTRRCCGQWLVWHINQISPRLCLEPAKQLSKQ